MMAPPLSIGLPCAGRRASFRDGEGIVCRAGSNLSISFVIALLFHVGVFLMLLIFVSRKHFDEPPRVVSVVWLKTAQADSPNLAAQPVVLAKPLRAEQKSIQPKTLPIRVASESDSASLAPVQTPTEQTKAADGLAPAPVLRHEAKSAPVPPVPPEPVSAPRFDADYLSNPAPEYPADSRMLREEGRVFLRIHVSEEGLPDEVTLQRSSGFPRLDQASVAVIWRWKFIPARQDGKAVAATVVVPINFTLRR